MRTRTRASRNSLDNSTSGLVSCSSKDVNYKAIGLVQVDVEIGKGMKDGNVTVMICVKNLATVVMITIAGMFFVHCEKIH